MEIFWIILAVVVIVTLVVIVASYVCFRIAFYVPNRDSKKYKMAGTPEGKIYEPFKELMEKWQNETVAMQHEEFFITAFDGLKLCGRYYEYKKDAPIELMFHGYRGNAYRDLSGGVQRCFALGRSAFIVDQRCSGKSEGNVITFGINERRDCLEWIKFMVAHFGSEVKIILTGISMGASTVLMASGEDLPSNVIGVLADCGYSAPKDIIIKTIREMRIPVTLGYFLVKLGARLFGHFNLEESSPVEAMQKCSVPVIFFHGDNDDYVPCEMSEINYKACRSEKMLVIINGAGHGLSYPAAPEKYLSALKEFFGEEASCNE